MTHSLFVKVDKNINSKGNVTDASPKKEKSQASSPAKTPKAKRQKSKSTPVQVSSHSSSEDEEEKKANITSGKTSHLSESPQKSSTLKKKGGEKRDIE